MCDAGASSFVWHYFRDCLYNGRDMFGFCCGLASIGCWVVAQFPQIVHNIRTQSVEALSPWFLAEWLLGDTCNLIGCILSGTQLATQLYSAMYFIMMDCIMVVQYVWYGTIARQKERRRSSRASRASRDRRSSSSQAQRESNGIDDAAGSSTMSHFTRPGAKTRVLACAALVVLAQSQSQWPGSRTPGGVRLLQEASPGFHSPHREHANWQTLVVAVHWRHWRSDWSYLAGSAIGYLSTAFYLGSRVSQIFKNWQRQSAEGLAISMFMFAIAANTLYGLGIIVRAYSWGVLLDSAPWILGSLGTVGLDAVIFFQWKHYSGQQSRSLRDDSEPLIDANGTV
ncbi:hypothetical protein WJX73_007317 [Symbiochloris irregularis]|uniref:Uncharacterized protein n=1 Tax=Symbiochloris irregularis TaxID=706552 RepID=A0AAW1NND8_9CHLO